MFYMAVFLCYNIFNEITKKSSDYRIIIFCDADFEKLTPEQLSHIENFDELKNRNIIKSILQIRLSLTHF